MKKYILLLLAFQPFLALSQNLPQNQISLPAKETSSAKTFLKGQGLSDLEVKANLKMLSNDFQGALPFLNKIIKLNPNGRSSSPDYINRGRAKHALKDFPGALKDFNKGILLWPNMSSDYFYRANLKTDIKDFTGAMKDYNKAIELASNYEYAYFNRGNLKVDIGDYRGGIEDYNIVVKLNSPIFVDDVFYKRGYARAKLEDYEGALQDYNTSIFQHPEIGSTYFNRGITKLILKDKNGGCLDLSKAGELGSSDAYDMIKKYCN